MRTLLATLLAPVLLAQTIPGSPLPQAVLEVELHQAALHNDPARVKVLLARGARVDAETPDGRTALFACAKHADGLAVAKLLVGAKADVNHGAKDGWTPLHAAADEGSGTLLSFLIEMGAKVDLRDNTSRTPLQILAGHEKPVVALGLQALLKAGARAEASDEYGVNALMQASKKGNVEAMAILLKAGASPNAFDLQGRTPLMYACMEAQEGAVKLLLTHGALPQSRDKDGHSPLMHLESYRSLRMPNGGEECLPAPLSVPPAILKLLMQSGFDPKGKDGAGNTELTHALYLKAWGLDLLKALLEAGCDPKAANDEGDNLLMAWAKVEGAQEALAILAGYGLDPNLKNRDGLAPIHLLLTHAADYNLPAFSTFLALFKPDLHLPGPDGAEPLAYEVRHSGPSYWQQLLQGGVHVSHRDAEGDTPLSEAIQTDREAWLPLLLAAGAKPEDAFRGDWEALAREVKTGKAAACFADLALKDEHTITVRGKGAIWTKGALVTAILKGDLDFIKAAAAAGVDLSVPWRQGGPPFGVLWGYAKSRGELPEPLKPMAAFATEWVRARDAQRVVAISQERVVMASGSYQSFIVRVGAERGKLVTWRLEGDPTSGSIKPDGQFSAVFTANAPGHYRIVATSKADPALTGYAEVKVVNAMTEVPAPAGLPDTHGGISFIPLSGFKVLQVGGWSGSAPMASVFLWEGGTVERFALAGSLLEARLDPLGLALDANRALVCNGATEVDGRVRQLRSAEVFELATGASKAVKSAIHSTSSTYFAHCGGILARIPGGGALLLGGHDEHGQDSGAECFEPGSGQFSLLAERAFPSEASFVTLGDGRILIFGGQYHSGRERGLSREILAFDPKTLCFGRAGKLILARAAHRSTLLPDGKVLISGGWIQGWRRGLITPTARCELFDPATGTSEEAGSLSEAKAGHAAALGFSGQVVTYGGFSKAGASPVPCATMELYDPDTRAWMLYDHPPHGIGNPVLLPLPSGGLFNGGSAIAFDAGKRNLAGTAVRPCPQACRGAGPSE